MSVPLRIGVMQLTMEPLEEILAHAQALDRHGFDTIWLAEAYPWWRKHQMEARSSTVLSALIAQATERLTSAGASSRRSLASRSRWRWTRESPRRSRRTASGSASAPAGSS